MNQNKLVFLERVTLLLLIITLPFNGLPRQFFLSFLGRDLTNSFFTLGMALLIIGFIKYRFYVPPKAIKYFIAFYGWYIFCLALGLAFYPYDQSFMAAQSDQVQRILQNFDWLISSDAQWPYKTIYFFENASRILRRDTQFCLIAFWVWRIYRDNWKKGFEDINKAVLVLVLMLGTYSLVELSWLKFNSKVAENILVFINSHLYVPAANNGWWPPLLWPGRLRSLLREPSFFGILSAFLLPFLWSWMGEKKHKGLYGLLIGYFCLMIAATNSRTAVSVTAFELLLLVLSVALVRTADYTRKVIAIICICLCGFGFNLVNLKSVDVQVVPKVSASEGIQESEKKDGASPGSDTIFMSPWNYFENNIGSVASTDKFSNNARLAVVVTELNVIRRHPITGVGKNLNAGYMLDSLPKFAYQNTEVKSWINEILKNDKRIYLLGDAFPDLNIYTSIGVSSGMPGILLYVGFIIYPLVKVLRYGKQLRCNPLVILISISLLGLAISGFSNKEYSNCIGIPIGLLLCCKTEFEMKGKKNCL